MAHDSQIIDEIFFKLLIKCPLVKLKKLVHHLVDLFCGQKNIFYEQYSDVWTLLEWWDLICGSRRFFLRFQSTTQEVPGFSSLPQEFRNVLKESFNVRNADLRDRLVEKSHEISPAYLCDFDWKLKMTLASDKMAQINEPRLLLNLDISGDRNKSLCLDLSKDELKSLIDAMEKANKALQDILINE